MAATGHPRFGSADRRGIQPSKNSELGSICGRLFEALGPLHRMTGHDAEVLMIAAGAMRPAEATQPLTATDYRVIDGALDFAADALPHFWPAITGGLPVADSRRALWIAAMLRLATALDWDCGPVDDVYVAWTTDVLHLEVDAARATSRALTCVRNRTAALEFVAGRRVLLTDRHLRHSASAGLRQPAGPELGGVVLSHG